MEVTATAELFVSDVRPLFASGFKGVTATAEMYLPDDLILSAQLGNTHTMTGPTCLAGLS
jgi:hypothetical protein